MGTDPIFWDRARMLMPKNSASYRDIGLVSLRGARKNFHARSRSSHLCLAAGFLLSQNRASICCLGPFRPSRSFALIHFFVRGEQLTEILHLMQALFVMAHSSLRQ
jgi:hypothetical protein